MGAAEDRELLEALDADEDLRGLQLPLPKFNIFGATGDVRHELNHSHFLYFLLNPQGSHELQDKFIKNFLRRALPQEDFVATFNGPGRWSAYREYHLTNDDKSEKGRVDILLLHEAQGLAVIIENKIDSDEHSNQLDYYYREMTARGYDARGIYLTPDGRDPSHEKYAPISYGVICSAITEMLNDETVAGDIRTLMTHYVEMVRRHIVDELGIDAVCQRIYGRHKKAITLVRKRVFARQERIGGALEDWVRQETEQEYIYRWSQPGSEMKAIRFILPEWKDELLYTKEWDGPLKSILELAVANSPQEVHISLTIGPGRNDTRLGLFNMASNIQKGGGGFRVDGAVLSQYSQIYHHPLLLSQKYEELSTESLVQEAGSQWIIFAKQDLPLIRGVVQQWITETRGRQSA